MRECCLKNGRKYGTLLFYVFESSYEILCDSCDFTKVNKQLLPSVTVRLEWKPAPKREGERERLYEI